MTKIKEPARTSAGARAVVRAAIDSVLQVMRQNARFSIYHSGDPARTAETARQRQAQCREMAALAAGDALGAVPAPAAASVFLPQPFVADYSAAAVSIDLFLDGKCGVDGLDTGETPAWLRLGGGLLAEDALIQQFARLRTRTGEGAVDAEELVAPFCALIEANDTSGPLTGAALGSVALLLEQGVLSHGGAHRALVRLTHALSHCRFEATDATVDEVVLLRIVQLVEQLVGDARILAMLNNRSLCEMIEAAFSVCFQSRASEVLRRAAQRALEQLVRAVFGRLGHVTASVRARVGAVATLAAFDQALSDATLPLVDAEAPFGLATVAELLRVLVSLADPHDDGGDEAAAAPARSAARRRAAATPPSRLAALALLETAAQVGSGALAQWIAWGRELERQLVGLADGHADCGAAADTSPPASPARGRRPSSRPDAITIHTSADDGEPAEIPRDEADGGAARPGAGETSPGAGDSPEPPPAPPKRPPRRSADDLPADNDLQLVAVSLANLAGRELFRHLLQCVRNNYAVRTHNPHWTHVQEFVLALRVLTALARNVRPHLKLTYAALLEELVAILDAGITSWDISGGSPGPGASGPTAAPGAQICPAAVREQLLSALDELVGDAAFLPELWVNIDGDPASHEAIVGRLVNFLARHSLPDATPGGPFTMPAHQFQAFEVLFGFLRHMAGRWGVSGWDVCATDPLEKEPVDAIERAVQHKALLQAAAAQFNARPKDGVAFLVDNGVVKSADDSAALSEFMQSAPGLSKRAIGDYISRPDQVALLEAFIGHLDFSHKRIDEALRAMLEQFRLPGEAQQIGRILEAFSKQYYATATAVGGAGGGIASADAAYVLAYSVIMLNTDQHNPHVRKPMTVLEFTRNNRGVNDGRDFEPAYLAAIYERIRADEIIMPGEHEGTAEGFRFWWQELQRRAAGAAPFVAVGPAETRHDRALFARIWPDLLSSVSYAFDASEDDRLWQRAAVGLLLLAQLAARFGHSDALGNVVGLLAKRTLVARSEDDFYSVRRLADSGEPPQVVDMWVAELGASQRAQIAAMLFFRVALDCGPAALHGPAAWAPVVAALQNLFVHGALPPGVVNGAVLEQDGRAETAGILEKMPPAASLLVLLTQPHAAQLQTHQQHLQQTRRRRPAASVSQRRLYGASAGDDAGGSPGGGGMALAASAAAGNNSAQAAAGGGLLSTLSQLLSITASGDDPDAHEPASALDAAAAAHARSLVAHWRLETLVREGRGLGSGTAFSDFYRALALHAWVSGSNPLVAHASGGVLLEWMTELVLQDSQRMLAVWDVFAGHVGALVDAYVAAFGGSGAPMTQLSAEAVQRELGGGVPSLALMARVVVSVARVCKRVLNAPVDALIAPAFSLLLRLGELPAVATPVLSPDPFLVPYEVSPVVEQLQCGIFHVVTARPDAAFRCNAVGALLIVIVGARGDPRAGSVAFGTLEALVSSAVVELEALGALPAALEQVEGEAAEKADAVDEQKGPFERDPELLNQILDALLAFAGAPVLDRIAHEMHARISQAQQTLESRAAREALERLGAQRRALFAAAGVRAVRALDHVAALQRWIAIVGTRCGIKPQRLWYGFWLRLLTGVAQLAGHPLREVRQRALGLLQRLTLAPEVAASSHDGTPAAARQVVLETFEHVLFPLLDSMLERRRIGLVGSRSSGAAGDANVLTDADRDLAAVAAAALAGPLGEPAPVPQSPVVESRARSDLDEARTRVAALACKAFLHHAGAVDAEDTAALQDYLALWLRLLDTLHRFLDLGAQQASARGAASSDYLFEAIRESLKNVLLVLFTQPGFRAGDFWSATWTRVDAVMPGLRGELFPDGAESSGPVDSAL